MDARTPGKGRERRGEAGIDGPLISSRRGFFWVGVERVELPSGTFVRGPMFVTWEAPENPRHPDPVVLIHGGGGQGLDWLGTPDGRPGWATYLVEDGYVVYVVDRPGHGRSPLHPEILGPMSLPLSYEMCAGLFGFDDDSFADQFMASQGPMLADIGAAQALEQERGAELLDRIGPAILVSHSAGGPMGWLLSDARPDLVRAHVAVEPLGPPFREEGLSLPHGVTAVPLDLARVSRVPIALVTGDASPFANFDHLTANFLQDGGCSVDLIRLADHGIRGNGHGLVFEQNNREVLGLILEWLANHSSP
jgi:pimeloyl-ACP methyl ester carboxylesterase